MRERLEKRPVIHVKTLGEFSLSMGDKRISGSRNRSKKMWSLLSYLIMNRGSDISVNELFHAVWQDEGQDNPLGALKTLVFRVRRMLDGEGFPGQDLILCQKGGYMWNPQWELDVDAERFEGLCSNISSPPKGEARYIEECREAFLLYEGGFLAGLTEENWVAPMRTYYRSLYGKLVCSMSEHLMEESAYGQVEDICRKAADIDPFGEEFHYYLICAMYKMERQREALDHYRSVTEQFYRERLMTPSERFKELYEIISVGQQEVITDLTVIQEAMDRQESQGKGAYLCEYAVFKRLVQLEKRVVARSGDSEYLCLLTVGDRRGRTLKAEIQARAMERLKNVIQSALRSSDSYSRYSVSQYIILLPATNYENGERVMQRILSAFNKAYVRKDVAVSYSLKAVRPSPE